MRIRYHRVTPSPGAETAYEVYVDGDGVGRVERMAMGYWRFQDRDGNQPHRARSRWEAVRLGTGAL